MSADIPQHLTIDLHDVLALLPLDRMSVDMLVRKLRDANSAALKRLADQIEAAFPPPREPGWYQVDFDGLTLAYYWNGTKFMYGPDSVTGLSDRAAERFENITPLAVVP